MQAFFQKDGGLVAEHRASVGNVGLGVANVTIAGRIVTRLERLAGDGAQSLDNFIQVNAHSSADVEDSA